MVQLCKNGEWSTCNPKAALAPMKINGWIITTKQNQPTNQKKKNPYINSTKQHKISTADMATHWEFY